MPATRTTTGGRCGPRTSWTSWSKQLSQAFGLGGRDRNGGSSAQRARSAVAYRIRSAIKQIGAADDALGKHLTNSIRMGVWCWYQPESAVAWTSQREVELRPCRSSGSKAGCAIRGGII